MGTDGTSAASGTERPILFVSFFELAGAQRHGAVARIRALHAGLSRYARVDLLELSGTGASKVLRPRNFFRLLTSWIRLSAGRYRAVVVAFPYLIPVLSIAAALSRTPIVLDAHNVEMDRAATLGKNGRAAFLRNWERWAVRRSRLVLAVSDADAARFRQEGATMARIVPNGVDTDVFRPGLVSPLRRDHPERALVGFFGDARYGPNAEAVEFIVHDLAPALSTHPRRPLFVVSGSHGRPAEWISPNVFAIGRVPEIAAYVAGCDYIVVPLHLTAGTHLKVVEALAAGRTVVTTPEGAAGLALRPGHDAWIVPRSQIIETMKVVLERGTDPRMERHARETAERFSWQSVAALLANAFDEAGIHLGPPMERKASS